MWTMQKIKSKMIVICNVKPCTDRGNKQRFSVLTSCQQQSCSFWPHVVGNFAAKIKQRAWCVVESKK